MPERSKATGVVCRNREDRGHLSSGGRISEGHGVPRTKQGFNGVTGSGSCGGRAIFDSSGGDGLEETECVYTEILFQV